MVFKGTRALEEWSRRVCSGYPGVNINNVTTAFKDGLAFCAIIHRFRPELIDFASLEAVNVKENCELAFSLADKYLGIPPLLDPEDMAECSTPDRKSILLYLSQIYQVLGNQSPEPSPRPSKLDLITNNTESVSTAATASKIKFRKNSTDSGIDTNLSISVDSVSSSSGVSSESDLSPQLRSEPLKKLKTDTAKIVKSEDLSTNNADKSDFSAAKLDVIPPKPVRTFAHGKVKYNNVAGSNENSAVTTNNNNHSFNFNKTNTLEVEGGNSKEETKTDSSKDNDSIKSEPISSQQQQFESTTRVLYLQHNITTASNNNNGHVVDNNVQNNGNSHSNVSKITNSSTKDIIAKTNGLDTAKDGHSANKNDSSTTGVANKNDSVPSIKSTPSGLQGILKKAGQPPKSGVSILREASTRLKPGEIQITCIKKEGVGGEDKSSPSFHNALNVFTNLEKGNIVSPPNSQNSDKSIKSTKKPSDTDKDCETSDKEYVTAVVTDEKCAAPVLVTSSAATQTDFPPILKQSQHKNQQSGENNKHISGGFEKTRKKIHNRERTRTISDMRANSIIVRAVQAEEARTKDPLVKTRSQGSLEVTEVKQNQPKTRPGADLRVRSTEVLDWVHSRQPLQPAMDHLHGYGTLDSRRDIYQQHELVRPSGTYKNYYNHLASNSLIGEKASSPLSSGPILPGPPSNLSVSAPFVRPVSHTESLYASYSSLFSNTRLLANQEANRHNCSIPPGPIHTAFQPPGSLVQPPAMSLTTASQAKRQVNLSKPETCNVTDFVRTFDTRLYVKALPNHAATSIGMPILSGTNLNQYHLPAAAPASIVTTPTSNNHALTSKCPTIHPAAQVSTYKSPVAGKLMWKTPPPASTTPLPPSTPQLTERNMSASPIGVKSVHFNGGRSMSHDYEHSTLV